MITEKDFKNSKFFTTDGSDIWRVTHVKTLTVVELLNCLDGQTETIQIGEQSSIRFVPFVMPKGMAADLAKNKTGKKRAPYKTKKPATAKMVGGVKKGTKRGKYKIKRGTVHENGSGVKAGKKASSQYLGVSVQKTKGGKKRYIAQLRETGGYKHLGTHNTEESAAAAVQDHLGNKEEATRLRKLAEAKTDEEIKQLTGRDKVTAWDCSGCGQGYKYKPDVCGKCGGHSFTPARPESEVSK